MSCQFNGVLWLEDLGPDERTGRNRFALKRDLVWTCAHDAGGVQYTVPEGYITDFASVPRALWFIVPPFGRYNRAAVLHDYLYELPGVTRFHADAMFREAMYHLNVPWHRRLAIYYSVRLFGGLARWWGKRARQ